MILAFIIIVSVASSDMLSHDDSEIINDNDTFVVGVDVHIPPFAFENNTSEPVGFDLDLAQEVCNRNGWNLVVKPIIWKEKQNELDSDSIDCVWCCFVINGRENDYTWSEPYLKNTLYIKKKSSF